MMVAIDKARELRDEEGCFQRRKDGGLPSRYLRGSSAGMPTGELRVMYGGEQGKGLTWRQRRDEELRVLDRAYAKTIKVHMVVCRDVNWDKLREGLRQADGTAGYIAEFHRLFMELAPDKKGSLARARTIGGIKIRAIERIHADGSKEILVDPTEGHFLRTI